MVKECMACGKNIGILESTQRYNPDKDIYERYCKECYAKKVWKYVSDKEDKKADILDQ